MKLSQWKREKRQKPRTLQLRKGCGRTSQRNKGKQQKPRTLQLRKGGGWTNRRNKGNNGKVKLPSFPLPPDEINSLWYDQTSKGKLFRQNARHINNAVCISSIQVNERSRGFQPTVVFEGRVQHRVGPLQAEDGEIPRFVQLYVHDPSLESAQRFKNMYIPANVSHNHKQQLEGILTSVQQALHTNNPFVRDLKQIMEIGEEQLPQGKIIISNKSRPTGEHARRYNEQLNL